MYIDVQRRLNTSKENLISFSSKNDDDDNNNINNNNNNNNNNNKIIIIIIYHQDFHHHHQHHHLNKKNFFRPSFPPQQTTLKQNFFGSAPRIPPAPSVSLIPPDNYFLINTKFGENVIEKPEKVTENIEMH